MGARAEARRSLPVPHRHGQGSHSPDRLQAPENRDITLNLRVHLGDSRRDQMAGGPQDILKDTGMTSPMVTSHLVNPLQILLTAAYSLLGGEQRAGLWRQGWSDGQVGLGPGR